MSDRFLKCFRGSPASFFDRWAKAYDRDLLRYNYQIPQQIFEVLWPALSTRAGVIRLLDMGIGTGLCSLPFRETGRVHITGVDLSEKMLARCQRKNIADEVWHADITQPLPILAQEVGHSDSGFDAVLLGGVLEFIADPAALFANIAGLLKPDGVVVIAAEAPQNRKLYQPGVFAGVIKEEDAKVTIRRFVPRSLWPRSFCKYLWEKETVAALLGEAGLKVISHRDVPAYQWAADQTVRYDLFTAQQV